MRNSVANSQLLGKQQSRELDEWCVSQRKTEDERLKTAGLPRGMRMMRICLFVTLLCCLSFIASGQVLPHYYPHYDFVPYDRERTLEKLDATKKWWETASFYQIYPRSFKDSDGDGVGDLKGIAEQLPYLKEIGITAAWISPIFTSPMADFGYDIANFTEIDSIFGSMADFEALMVKSKEVGVKILLDFVPNHTSDECEWFKRSAAKDPEYKDFYVWHPGKMIDGVPHPPTNWRSVFRGSAWQWHNGRQEYYLHQFVAKQPDLNYRNPKVKEAMNEVLRFWLRKGVAGFRVDAVPHVFEVAPDGNGNWPDEPRNDWVTDPDSYDYVKHIYTVDQPETLDMVYEWRRVLDEFQKENGGDERILMAETYSPLDTEMKYYGNGTVDGAQIPFNFLLITWITNDSDAYHYAETINTWLRNMPEGRTANWVIGNHDQHRVSARLGVDRIDMMNMLVLTLPGCSVTYQGEEIGMENVWISWKDTVDPAACNSNPDIYEQFSRDPERTPFQWSDGLNAGFSDAAKTWLPIGPDYKEVNVERERSIPTSHLNLYKHLMTLRQEATFRHGDAEIKAVNNAVVGVKRSLLHDYTYVYLMNIFDQTETVDLTKAFAGIPAQMEYAVVTDKSAAKIGDAVDARKVQLLPKEAVLLRSPNKLTTTIGYYTYYKAGDKN